MFLACPGFHFIQHDVWEPMLIPQSFGACLAKLPVSSCRTNHWLAHHHRARPMVPGGQRCGGPRLGRVGGLRPVGLGAGGLEPGIPDPQPTGNSNVWTEVIPHPENQGRP